MPVDNQYYIKTSLANDFSDLQKGLWIVIVNATRVPPHIGLAFNGFYFSLSIKGVEQYIDITVLLRKIEIQGIKAVFVKLKKHPVFSVDFLKEYFLTELTQYTTVSIEHTCFKPVRSFFQENYALWNYKMNYLYELFPALYSNNLIEAAFALNMDADIENDAYFFKKYSAKEIEDELTKINKLQLNND